MTLLVHSIIVPSPPSPTVPMLLLLLSFSLSLLSLFFFTRPPARQTTPTARPFARPRSKPRNKRELLTQMFPGFSLSEKLRDAHPSFHARDDVRVTMRPSVVRLVVSYAAVEMRGSVLDASARIAVRFA